MDHLDHLDHLSPETAAALDRALLEADPETLTDTQLARRTALAARAKPARAPARPSTAAAAERALGRLPTALAAAIGTDRRLRESEAALLALLCARARRQEGVACAPSVPDLANRLGCAERTVQLAARALTRHGLISIQERPICPGHNQTNVYTVICPRLVPLLASRRCAPRGESRPPGGESRTTVKDSQTYTSNPESQRVTPHVSGQCKPARQASPPGTCQLPPSPPPRLPHSGELRVLADRALAHIAPGLREATRQDPNALWEAWDRLRLERLAAFSPRLWRRALGLHGARAHLAVAETLLKLQAGQISRPEGYLWGILKHGIAGGTARSACNPERSVAEILDERAAGPAATKAALAIALSEALAAQPKERQIRYLRNAGPADRRRAGRLARRADRAGFVAEIARVAGSGEAPVPPSEAGDGLDVEVYETVRRLAPGCDIAELEASWRGWCARTGSIPDRPAAHFVAFCKRRSARRSATQP